MWAKRIALAETQNLELADQAFIAGLLHDVGKLVLASGLPSQYQISVNRQREKRIPLMMIFVGMVALAIFGLSQESKVGLAYGSEQLGSGLKGLTWAQSLNQT